MRAVALAVCLFSGACVVRPSLALGPRMQVVPPPEPTQPLVATPPLRDQVVSPSGLAPDYLVLPPSVATSLATLVLYFITGAPPFITLFGFFEENRLVE
jgi:hypothetical protein